ncbi:hypothetical protein Adt_26829 [Abeliophyllum distichum]|uniref:Uncharacterized protein n=1 Tax=Abeliophyllum distichum TaxID=126358 RepID=A0ABD1RTX5_9LAMI
MGFGFANGKGDSEMGRLADGSRTENGSASRWVANGEWVAQMGRADGSASSRETENGLQMGRVRERRMGRVRERRIGRADGSRRTAQMGRVRERRRRQMGRDGEGDRWGRDGEEVPRC